MEHRRTLILLGVLVITSCIFLYDRFGGSKSEPSLNDPLVNDFIKLYHSSGIHNRTEWLGIPTLENPCDMWSIQEIVNEIKPDFKTNNNFVSDRSREKFLLTFFPKGYLKRIK